MTNSISFQSACILGFGEAGPVFASALRKAGLKVFAYDLLQESDEHGHAQIEKTVKRGIKPSTSAADAVSEADLVVSTVTASQAIEVVGQAAAGLSSKQHWLDLNSVSPETKRQIQKTVAANGARFTEAVAMDTVPQCGIKVPLLMCGEHAQALSYWLNDNGLNTKSLGQQSGLAASTKLFRSVVIKGMESLFAESMEAAGHLGVENAVIESLCATYPGLDWHEVADYMLHRSVLHAQRRAAEMREAAALVGSVGVTATMSAATVQKQQELADRDLRKSVAVNSVAEFVSATQVSD